MNRKRKPTANPPAETSRDAMAAKAGAIRAGRAFVELGDVAGILRTACEISVGAMKLKTVTVGLDNLTNAVGAEAAAELAGEQRGDVAVCPRAVLRALGVATAKPETPPVG